MSPPSSSVLADLEEPQEDCTVPEDVLTELEDLRKSFVDLVGDIENETETRIKNGTVEVRKLVSRVERESIYDIKEITTVKTTDEFFRAIRPFYTFLNCQLILSIALYLCGSIAEQANEYDSRITRFRKNTKVKYLQRILKRCYYKFRQTNRTITIGANDIWGWRTVFFVEQLIVMLFPLKCPNELQWFEVIPGSIIMTFIISEHMILPFIEKSKKKLEFMRLMGIISLKIGDEFVLKSDGENGVFSFEDSLIEATMVDNIEAVEFLLQYVQVNVNIKNTNRSLINSKPMIALKERDVVYNLLRQHHKRFIVIMKDIEHELYDLMNEIEMTNSAVDKLQSLSVQAMDKWSNEILSRDNFLSGQLLATSKFLKLSDSMLNRINQYNDSIEARKRQSLIIHLHKSLEEYFHNPFPDTVKATITLPIVWSKCSVWLVEQLIQLIVSPGHFIEFQFFRVINKVDSLVVIFLIPADLAMELKGEIMKNMESARLLGSMQIEIDDMTVLHYSYNMEYSFDKGIDQARKEADEKVVDILVRANHIPVELIVELTAKDDNNNHRFVLHHDSTPLMIACCNDNSQLVKLLLQYKADPNIEDIQGVTALMYGTGNSTIFKMLLDHGADLNATDVFKYAMMHYACAIGNIPVVEIILTRNRDLINTISTIGETPLFVATISEQLAVVKRLLKEHADPNIQHIRGGTPLHYASSVGYLLIVQELLHHHADPNIQMTDGITPLMAATFKGHLSIVQLLLQSGADPTLKDHDNGQTALDIAVRKDHSEIIDILH